MIPPVLLIAAACWSARHAGAGGFSDDLERLRAHSPAIGRAQIIRCEKNRARVRALEASGLARTPRYRRARAACDADAATLAPVFADNERVNRDAVLERYASRFVPYLNQHEPRQAPATYNGHFHCGKTTMAMIARAFGFGKGMSDAELIDYFGARAHSPPTHGFGLRAWPRMAGAAGLGVAMKGPRADRVWIEEQLKAGRLVAALGVYAAMAPHADTSKVASATTGHYVAVIGKTADGRFLVNDPADPLAKTLTPSELDAFLNAVPARRAKATCPDGRPTCEGWQIAIGPSGGGAPPPDLEADDEADRISRSKDDAYWDEH